jgi:uncharacterized membrane protein YdjX (TVP38/TMEM64 family)
MNNESAEMRETMAVLKNILRIIVLLLVVGLIAAWRWSPLGEALTAENVLALSRELRDMRVSPFIAVPCMIVGSVLMLPLTSIVVASGLLFGFGWGFFYAFVSGVVSGMLGFYMGRFVGQAVVQRLAGNRIHRFSAAAGGRGVLATVALRVIPFAPFTIQNMIAGASHIKHWDFGVGNAIGLIPSTLFILLVMDQLNASLESPDAGTITGLVLIAAATAAGLYGLRRWLVKRLETPLKPGED